MDKSIGTPPSLEQKKALPKLWQRRWKHNCLRSGGIAAGHEHILVILDYASRYPEALPLRAANAKNMSRVYIYIYIYFPSQKKVTDSII